MRTTNPVHRRRLEQLSEETEPVARQMSDPDAKRAMRHVAWGYEVLAGHARQRECRDAPHHRDQQ